MVESLSVYDIVWTPEFTEEVFLAVDYVQNQLMMPIAARNLLEGITAALETKRAMPQSAPIRKTTSGTPFYMTTYKRWNIYYTIEGSTLKAVALKHQLQR